MCIRIHQLFFLSVGVVAGRAREQYGMNHAKKSHGRLAIFIIQCMWNEIFFNEQPGMKNK